MQFSPSDDTRAGDVSTRPVEAGDEATTGHTAAPPTAAMNSRHPILEIAGDLALFTD